MESLIKTIFCDQLKQIDQKKEKLLEDRLKAMGVDLNEVKQHRRFPLVVSEIDDKQVERIYYNDGSKFGVLVITFYPLVFDNPRHIDGCTKFEMSINYK